MKRKVACLKCGSTLNYGMAEKEYHMGPLEVDEELEPQAMEKELWSLEPGTCQDRDSENYLICPDCDMRYDTDIWIKSGLLVPKAGSYIANQYYFLMESSGRTPYLKGWVVVHADDFDEAKACYNALYPSDDMDNFALLLSDSAFQCLRNWCFQNPESGVISAYHKGSSPVQQGWHPDEAICVHSDARIRLDVLGGICFIRTEKGHEVKIWDNSILEMIQM